MQLPQQDRTKPAFWSWEAFLLVTAKMLKDTSLECGAKWEHHQRGSLLEQAFDLQ